MDEIDYLAVGHICQDVTPAGPRLGGTVSFSALTARALGLRVGIVSSFPSDMAPLLTPLDGVATACLPAESATTFENIYTPAGRRQTLLGRAAPLSYDAIPAAWRSAPIVHLAPVAREVDPRLAGQFEGACVCVTPQGWLRTWDARGRVRYGAWRAAEPVLGAAAAVVLSVEDAGGDERAAAALASRAKVGVVTRGAGGSTLYLDGEPQRIPAPPVEEVDPTGAGDIFAAAFFAQFCQSRDPLLAARFATLLASASVARVGLASIPDAEAIRRARAEMRR